MLHVSLRLLLVERPQVIARRHALRELTQVAPGEQIGELGLADQDHLKELFLRRLQIRQETDLLQHAGAQVLGLVDDEDGPPAAGVGVEHRLRQGVDQDFQARRARRVRDAQLVAHRGQELDRGEPRIEDHGDVDVGRELLEQGTAHRGLAGSDLTRQLHEAAALPDPIEQMGQGFPVRVAQIEVARIRGQRERPLRQPEVSSVHGVSPMVTLEKDPPNVKFLLRRSSRPDYCPRSRTSS